MPTFQRKTLRQDLGRLLLHDTTVGTTTATSGVASLVYAMDYRQADLSLSQEGGGLYQRSWLRVNGMDLRIATFNCGSGAFITQQLAGTIVPSGAEYEVHELISPTDKDRAIDLVVQRLCQREEFPISTRKDAKHYAIDDRVRRVCDVWYYADPDNSANRDRRHLDWWKVDSTGSGREIRIEPALDGSQQLILDAILHLTLGPSDTATVNLPDEVWLLYGAEAQCWEMLSKNAPGKETSAFRINAKRAAIKFSNLTAKYSPQIDDKIRFDNPVD